MIFFKNIRSDDNSIGDSKFYCTVIISVLFMLENRIVKEHTWTLIHYQILNQLKAKKKKSNHRKCC